MSEVLVLVDHVDGAVRKPTYELLTIAKRLGEPSAVFIGAADKADDAAAAVKRYGAEKFARACAQLPLRRGVHQDQDRVPGIAAHLNAP